MREINMNKKGFTLIELLIVVVIIGILAAIAIPRFGQTRERAFISAMQSDLRNLSTVQEQYHADNDYEYGGNPEIIDPNPPLFSASTNVTIDITVGGNPGLGWSALASHDGTDVECEIFVGSEADTEGVASGTIVCT